MKCLEHVVWGDFCGKGGEIQSDATVYVTYVLNGSLGIFSFCFCFVLFCFVVVVVVVDREWVKE